MTAPGPGVPSFAEFARPIAGDTDPEELADTPLCRLPAGDYAVLAWLDETFGPYSPGTEADLVARWDSVSLRDVYALVFGDRTTAKGRPA